MTANGGSYAVVEKIFDLLGAMEEDERPTGLRKAAMDQAVLAHAEIFGGTSAAARMNAFLTWAETQAKNKVPLEYKPRT
jgi:hypothetical protein